MSEARNNPGGYRKKRREYHSLGNTFVGANGVGRRRVGAAGFWETIEWAMVQNIYFELAEISLKLAAAEFLPGSLR